MIHSGGKANAIAPPANTTHTCCIQYASQYKKHSTSQTKYIDVFGGGGYIVDIYNKQGGWEIGTVLYKYKTCYTERFV